MKKFLHIPCLILFSSLTIFFSCKDQPVEFSPVAKFSILKIQNELVEFQNNSINATEFLWEFGDGTTSTERDPVHIYTEVGDYNVFLTAKLDGKSDQTSSIAAVTKIFPEELTELSNPPFGNSYDGLSFSWNGKGYAGYGINGVIYGKWFWEFNPIDETWTQLSEGPKEFVKGCSFLINGKVYMGMGQIPWGNGAKEFVQYDIATDTYTSIGSIPLPNTLNGSYWSDVTAFSYQEKGYVISSLGEVDSEVVVMEFNPDDLSWTQKSTFPGVAATGMVHFIIDGNLYIGMGDRSNFNGYQVTREFWNYDIANDSWTQLEDFPDDGRRDAIGFTYEGKGYIAFGYNNNPTTGELNSFPDIWEFNSTNKEWTRIESIPISFSFGGYDFLLGNKLYFGGGFGNNFGPLGDFYKYEF